MSALSNNFEKIFGTSTRRTRVHHKLGWCSLFFMNERACPSCQKLTKELHQPFRDDGNYYVCEDCYYEIQKK